GKIIDANRKFCELFEKDKSQLIGLHFWNLEHEKDDSVKLKRFEKLLSGKSVTYETEYIKSDDKKIFLDVSSKMIEVEGEKFIQSLYRDITEKKLLQEQLLQAQKMESIGILASGVAHDFNNLLTASLGHIELLLQFGGLDDNLKVKMKVIENSIRKAGNLVSKLLSFARKDQPTIAPVNMNQVVRDAVEMVEKVALKKKVDFNIEIDNSINLVNGDGNQLEQMLMNLLVNAIDAMPHGGVITIRTSNLQIKQKALFPTSLLEPGNYVVLTVSDTGTGIPENIRDKIFEPFFTTKEKGKGTGLGLPMVHGIVKAHNGLINVISEEGRGTTFEIFFPACGTRVELPEKSIFISSPKLHNIMLVDNERDILNSLKDLLEKNGYRVFATDNPAYAADIFQDIHLSIDLVITDLSMPLFDGAELISTIKSISPSVKVITISAHEHKLAELRSLKIVDGFIKKPFEINELLTMIRNVLSKNSII
ncbi:MAG: ATP-binding protein, partial [Thermodesulfovibrionales bacterium]|nr:ATP-binding protein [Thermodesulfovibrionales bacterium]